MNRVFNIRYDMGVIWFRVCNWGLLFRNARCWRESFSERNGYAICWRLGPVFVKVLTP